MKALPQYYGYHNSRQNLFSFQDIYISSYCPHPDGIMLLYSCRQPFPFFFFSTDIIDKSELKAFFESNCSQIYFIFYENFITLESNLKQKGE